MRYIKLFEGFQSKSKVAQFCLEYNIRDWSINSEGLVDVNGDVKLYNSGLNKIPIKFGKIIGYFDCSNNELKSLEGSPHTVVGDFDCSNNELKSLEGCTHTVGGNFYCQYNQLTSLEGSPHTVGAGFYCSGNQLTSLEGSPESIGGDFYCESNQITSFDGCPKKVDGDFYCYNNPVHSIWRLFSSVGNNKWDYQVIELFMDYDCIRGKDLIIDRFNDFLIEIGKDSVEKVKGYNNI
jgi:hypothetical protein